eukprot:SAG31_NODE_15731_length_741_cov_0.763240_1_plen_101_part_00
MAGYRSPVGGAPAGGYGAWNIRELNLVPVGNSTYTKFRKAVSKFSPQNCVSLGHHAFYIFKTIANARINYYLIILNLVINPDGTSSSSMSIPILNLVARY